MHFNKHKLFIYKSYKLDVYFFQTIVILFRISIHINLLSPMSGSQWHRGLQKSEPLPRAYVDKARKKN